MAPAAVNGLSGVMGIAAGALFSLAQKEDARPGLGRQ
jgi:hypothetical protein